MDRFNFLGMPGLALVFVPDYDEGSNIFRETLDGDWEATTKQKARSGDIYRIGEKGPYFRIAVRR
ncbi:MAG: hypothetical protein ABFS56_28355 [Pseudomonadota bacterium]